VDPAEQFPVGCKMRVPQYRVRFLCRRGDLFRGDVLTRIAAKSRWLGQVIGAAGNQKRDRVRTLDVQLVVAAVPLSSLATKETLPGLSASRRTTMTWSGSLENTSRVKVTPLLE